jgi:ribosome-associated toxin RatA of RatAB toxin-antitoxin module
VLGKDYYIESENTLDDNSISIKQIKGPFKKFEGKWSISSIDESSCLINFDAAYQLPFLLNAITPDYLVNSFSENIINSFIQRVS